MSTSCCNCGSPVGDDVKVHPVSCDDDVWCPRCFVSRRMREEPERFNATQAVAAKCTGCGYTTVSFGAKPQHERVICFHCFRPLAVKCPLVLEKREAKDLIEAVHEAARG